LCSDEEAASVDRQEGVRGRSRSLVGRERDIERDRERGAVKANTGAGEYDEERKDGDDDDDGLEESSRNYDEDMIGSTTHQLRHT
jgi:hypothetical protein